MYASWFRLALFLLLESHSYMSVCVHKINWKLYFCVIFNFNPCCKTFGIILIHNVTKIATYVCGIVLQNIFLKWFNIIISQSRKCKNEFIIPLQYNAGFQVLQNNRLYAVYIWKKSASHALGASVVWHLS